MDKYNLPSCCNKPKCGIVTVSEQYFDNRFLTQALHSSLLLLLWILCLAAPWRGHLWQQKSLISASWPDVTVTAWEWLTPLHCCCISSPCNPSILPQVLQTLSVPGLGYWQVRSSTELLLFGPGVSIRRECLLFVDIINWLIWSLSFLPRHVGVAKSSCAWEYFLRLWKYKWRSGAWSLNLEPISPQQLCTNDQAVHWKREKGVGFARKGMHLKAWQI